MYPFVRAIPNCQIVPRINESLAAKIGNWSKPRLDAVIEAVVAVAAVTQTSEFSALASECLTVFLSADCQLTKHAPAQFSPSHEYFLVKNLSFVFNSRRCFCSNQSVVKVGIKRDYQVDLKKLFKRYSYLNILLE